MAHIHEDSDTYYLDQLCLIALSAAFGGVCLTLYFLNIHMLKLMLGMQFHDLIAYSGFALLLLAAIRSLVLWRALGRAKRLHQHSHDCGHHGCPASHTDGHTHGQGNAHAPHEHAWAPWRYVLLLLPVFLFLLGLPNKPPRANAARIDFVESAETFAGFSAFAAEGPDPLQGLVVVAGLYLAGPAEAVRSPSFMRVFEAPFRSPELEGEWVRVKGQFAPATGGSDRAFNLAHHKIECCGADARQINLVVVSRASLSRLRVGRGDWIQVTGKIEFRPSGASRQAILRVSSLKFITPTDPDPEPYVR